MRPGEEIYLIHTWFPNETPKPLEFPESQGFYDVVVSYVDILDERKKNCVNTGAPKTTNSELCSDVARIQIYPPKARLRDHATFHHMLPNFVMILCYHSTISVSYLSTYYVLDKTNTYP